MLRCPPISPLFPYTTLFRSLSSSSPDVQREACGALGELKSNDAIPKLALLSTDHDRLRAERVSESRRSTLAHRVRRTPRVAHRATKNLKIGRASCRERVEISEGSVAFKKKM